MPRVRVLQAEPDQIGVSLNVTLSFTLNFYFIFCIIALVCNYVKTQGIYLQHIWEISNLGDNP